MSYPSIYVYVVHFILLPQAWKISEKLGLIGPACEQPEYNMFARKRVEKEYRPIYDK